METSSLLKHKRWNKLNCCIWMSCTPVEVKPDSSESWVHVDQEAENFHKFYSKTLFLKYVFALRAFKFGSWYAKREWQGIFLVPRGLMTMIKKNNNNNNNCFCLFKTWFTNNSFLMIKFQSALNLIASVKNNTFVLKSEGLWLKFE